MGRRCMLSRGREEEATPKAGGATTTMSAGCVGQWIVRVNAAHLRFVLRWRVFLTRYASLQGMQAGPLAARRFDSGIPGSPGVD